MTVDVQENVVYDVEALVVLLAVAMMELEVELVVAAIEVVFIAIELVVVTIKVVFMAIELVVVTIELVVEVELAKVAALVDGWVVVMVGELELEVEVMAEEVAVVVVLLLLDIEMATYAAAAAAIITTRITTAMAAPIPDLLICNPNPFGLSIFKISGGYLPENSLFSGVRPASPLMQNA